MNEPVTQRPLVCVGALVWGPDDRVLLVRTTKWRGHWGVPGGKVEWGETLAQAVAREFAEEVGLKLEDIRYAQTQEAVLSDEFFKPAHMLLIDFFARAHSLQVVPNEEIAEWQWLELEAAQALPLNTYTRTLVQLALAHRNKA